MTDLVLDVDGLGLVTAVLLLYGHQVTVSRHTQVGPQCQHRLVTRVQSLQNRLVPAGKGNNQRNISTGEEIIFLPVLRDGNVCGTSSHVYHHPSYGLHGVGVVLEV